MATTTTCMQQKQSRMKCSTTGLLHLGFFLLIFFNKLTKYGTSSFVQQLLQKPPTLTTAGDLMRKYAPTSFRQGNFSLALLRTLKVPTPSYVQIMENNQLSVTSFSLLRKGSIISYDLTDQELTPTTLPGNYLWPNELSSFRGNLGNRILLIPDGFLTPGQSNGGVYALINADNPSSRPIRLTRPKEGWFYHRAIHMQLPNSQHHGILTARATKPLIGKGEGELLWLPLPDNFEKSLSATQEESTYLDEVVLAKGPDVMFEAFDLNPDDDTIEVIAAHFFNKKLSVHSLSASSTSPYIKVVHSEELETEGRPYGLCLATFPPTSNSNSDPTSQSLSRTRLTRDRRDKFPAELPTTVGPIDHSPTHILLTTHECSYDLPSALEMAMATIQGKYPKIRTSKQCTSLSTKDQMDDIEDDTSNTSSTGGSLFVYQIPSRIGTSQRPQHNSPSTKVICVENHKSEESATNTQWTKRALFRGFKVRGWGGIFSPGAPGFPYVCEMPRTTNNNEKELPLIMLAGDCTGSAYVFTPNSQQMMANVPKYDLSFEIQCGATVGSLACSPAADGGIDLFVPAYELNQVNIDKAEKVKE